MCHRLGKMEEWSLYVPKLKRYGSGCVQKVKIFDNNNIHRVSHTSYKNRSHGHKTDRVLLSKGRLETGRNSI